MKIIRLLYKIMQNKLIKNHRNKNCKNIIVSTENNKRKINISNESVTKEN